MPTLGKSTTCSRRCCTGRSWGSCRYSQMEHPRIHAGHLSIREYLRSAIIYGIDPHVWGIFGECRGCFRSVVGGSIVGGSIVGALHWLPDIAIRAHRACGTIPLDRQSVLPHGEYRAAIAHNRRHGDTSPVCQRSRLFTVHYSGLYASGVQSQKVVSEVVLAGKRSIDAGRLHRCCSLGDTHIWTRDPQVWENGRPQTRQARTAATCAARLTPLPPRPPRSRCRGCSPRSDGGNKCCRGSRRSRRAAAVRRACPPPRCARDPSPGCGRRRGW